MTNLSFQKTKAVLIIVLCFAVLSVWGQTAAITDQNPVIANDYPLAKKVNPFIGTDAHGHTYPGVCLPFGMVQLSPDTYNEGWDWCSGYHYSDNSIMGFSHTHLSGTGCADYGDFLFMPTTGPVKTRPGSRENPEEGYRSRFSHEQEKACAGFYGVYLKDYDIDVQLTATKRVGVHQYTYPADKQANVIINLAHYIGSTTILESKVEIVGDSEVRGFVRKNGWSPNRYLYFTARFSKPFVKSGLVIDGTINESAKEAQAKNLQCYVQFDTSKGREIIVKVALSAVSCDGAARNMDAECPGWDFQKVCNDAMGDWQKQLSKLTVQVPPPIRLLFIPPSTIAAWLPIFSWMWTANIGAQTRKSTKPRILRITRCFLSGIPFEQNTRCLPSSNSNEPPVSLIRFLANTTREGFCPSGSLLPVKHGA
jgi:predicted alpha-1,2-mannosidase